MNAPYRMVFINDESMQEVASFKLTKHSVYALASTLFVVTVLVTVAILLLTPLKYYIPGYGSNEARTQALQIKQRVDSLSDVVRLQQQQSENIKKVIVGDFEGLKDTTMLDPDKVKTDEMNSIIPKVEEIKEEAIKQEKQEKKKKNA
jgi:hypothetical protein